MVDAWPSTMPQALIAQGASEGAGDGLAEYQPDTGPPITRLRTNSVVRPLGGYMICSDAQIATFRSFFNTTISRGALPFTFPDPMTGATLLVKFAKQSPPSWNPLGGNNYQLNLSLFVLP